MPRRPPPLDVELSRSVLNPRRADPALAAALNAVLLRATRQLRARMDEGARSLTVAGRREGIVLEVVLMPPDRCHVARIARVQASDAADLVV